MLRETSQTYMEAIKRAWVVDSLFFSGIAAILIIIFFGNH